MSFLSEPLLLVPIHVDALAVGTSLPDQEMFQWTSLAPSFSKLQDGNGYHFGAELVGDSSGTGSPFDVAAGLETGIHLLFRLPRAYSHGIQQGDDPLSFPAIPNRWLVQRFGEKPTTYKAWLIKSDAPATDSPGTPWPTFPNDEQTPVDFKRMIGACTELTASWEEGDEPAAVNLTVVGQGNPVFSAHYPACRSVLGFHDPLTDVSKEITDVSTGSRLSYLVTGWFSSATDDPLHTAAWRTGTVSAEAEKTFRAKNKIPDGVVLSTDQQSSLLWNAWLKERQWTCDFDPNVVPSRLLCHGLVRGITWHAEDWNYLQPSGAGASVSKSGAFPLNADNYEQAYQIAVGNTGAEALAALLTTGDVDQDLLAALQGGLLGQPVTAAELPYELHARRFDGVQGGTTFAVQPEPDRSPMNEVGGQNPASQGQSAILPEPLRDLLRELNEKQSECDRLGREIEDCRWQVYALWYLWTNELNIADDSTRIAKLHTQLTAFKEILKSAQNDLAAARRNRDALFTANKAPASSTGEIVDELARYPKTNPDGSPRLNDAGRPELKYRLVQSTALPFYEPSEPVIAVAGPAMARLNTAEPPGPCACRLSGNIMRGITLQVPGGPILTVTGEMLLKELLPDQPTVQGLEGANKSLLAESLLLDYQQAARIAGQAPQQYRDELTPIVRALQNPQSTEAQANPARLPNARVGSLPDPIAAFDWQRNPWIPMVLVWQASWQSDYASPAGQSLPAELVTDRWRLDTSGDLAPDNGATGGDTTTYQGYSILTPSAARNMAERLQELNEKHPLISRLTTLNAQLQRLGGFNDALIGQHPGMQIPPLDFIKWVEQSSFFIDPIRASLNDGFAPTERNPFTRAPDTGGNPFLPIRAGQLEITQLSIVDAFGQTLKLPVAQINESAATNGSMFRPAHSCVVEESSSNGSAITLRPRFVQPVRLRFEEANASTGTDPNGGPVCGWILPNHLEKSLTIYDAGGKPLGALQQKLGQVSGTSDRAAYYWVDVPGSQNGGGATTHGYPGRRLASIIKNIHLRHFCTWALSLSPDMGATFSDLVSETIASADQRVPDEDPGVSVLIGRPLALVRASVQLECAGLPAHRPELRADTGTSVLDLIETNGFEQVKWPLRLGDLAAQDDGLIGVFKGVPAAPGDDTVISAPFYPAWGRDKDLLENNVKIFATQDFSIDFVQPLEVTMLMDPQVRVHATTGVLPRIYFELPPEAATGAKRAREVFFQTAPVLGFSPTPAMPRPSDDYGEWSWAYRPDVTQWKLDPNIVEATVLGGFADAWPSLTEGWLKLSIAPVKVLSFWLREPTQQVARGTRVHLAWSLQGAESLELVKVKRGGNTVERIERWDAAPFPNEYGVVVDAETTYRIIASAADAKASARDLTIKIASA